MTIWKMMVLVLVSSCYSVPDPGGCAETGENCAWCDPVDPHGYKCRGATQEMVELCRSRNCGECETLAGCRWAYIVEGSAIVNGIGACMSGEAPASCYLANGDR